MYVCAYFYLFRARYVYTTIGLAHLGVVFLGCHAVSRGRHDCAPRVRLVMLYRFSLHLRKTPKSPQDPSQTLSQTLSQTPNGARDLPNIPNTAPRPRKRRACARSCVGARVLACVRARARVRELVRPPCPPTRARVRGGVSGLRGGCSEASRPSSGAHGRRQRCPGSGERGGRPPATLRAAFSLGGLPSSPVYMYTFLLPLVL